MSQHQKEKMKKMTEDVARNKFLSPTENDLNVDKSNIHINITGFDQISFITDLPPRQVCSILFPGLSHIFLRQVQETLDTYKDQSSQGWNTLECNFSSEMNNNIA